MKLQTLLTDRRLHWCLGVLTAMILTGCSTTSSVNWDARIGTYSWDDALAEFGDPDRVADLEGGVKAAEWITERNISRASAADDPFYTRGETIRPNQTYGTTAPPKVLRLSFKPDGKLFDWHRNY